MKKVTMITLKEDGKQSSFIYQQKSKYDASKGKTKWAKDIYKKDVAKAKQK